MKNTIWFCIVLLTVSTSLTVLADETATPLLEHKSSAKKPAAKKAPRSLLAVDPYDAQGDYVDPNDVEGEIAVDPYDAEALGVTFPNEPSSNVQENENGIDLGLPDIETPEFVEDWKNSWDEWRIEEFAPKPKPPLTWPAIGKELGAGYIGAFGGSVVGLFGGFLVGSLYGELAGCSHCWVDIATTTSVIGAALSTSSGVYMFGNTEQQLGSIYQTTAASFVPVIFAMALYNDSSQVQKSGFYILTMPVFATIGYNLSRYFRRPGERSFFEKYFEEDGWVSADPITETIAFNLRVRF